LGTVAVTVRVAGPRLGRVVCPSLDAAG